MSKKNICKIQEPYNDLIKNNSTFPSKLETEEKVLKTLFNALPENTDESIILIKIFILNKLYHTRIKSDDLSIIAKKIKSIRDFDKRIQDGDTSLINEICDINGIKRPYSFATKYCNWHNQNEFPIVDGHAKAYLYYLNKQRHFYDKEFTQNDLLSYKNYVNIYIKFIKKYDLKENFKTIDKYIWNYARANDLYI